MGWIVAAIVMVGVSAESHRLDANAAAVAADPEAVVCTSADPRAPEEFSSMGAARLWWQGSVRAPMSCTHKGGEA